MPFNPDIDRISIDDRVKALESRLPSGGGGITNISDLVLDPKIIDSCKQNAFTRINTGWVMRIDVPNWGTLPLAPGTGTAYQFTNLDVRFAAFYPLMNGRLCRPSTFFFRFTATANVSLGTATQISSYVLLSLDDTAFLAEINQLVPTYQANRDVITFGSGTNWSNYSTMFAVTPGQVHTLGDARLIYDPYIVAQNRKRLSLSIFRPSGTLQQTMIPCSSFGMHVMSPLNSYYPSHTTVTLIGSPVSRGVVPGQFDINPYGITVNRPQDLPAYLQKFYPTSWYT